ncbi:hypothetical protein [Phycisphaera mikurensis]|uniref:Beta-agarase n=1 Tax=Phycisphaera mikurensis (strain NBRC 102666 / KCTC 22515 / FYK2301M01) TaxID=1142394 RepID=I0IIJ9_PHYMF|nr:hypothetical protein [Phycisphaera mikurensis]MBB6442756.1 hypothetical protein [Phycisphaera mikurensis]BAM05087.1 beta-agarase [Phycisphaera mikurensis NBRC 102666]
MPTLPRLPHAVLAGLLLCPAGVAAAAADTAQNANDAHGETRTASARPDTPLTTASETLIDFSPEAGYDAPLAGNAMTAERTEHRGQTWLEVRTGTGNDYPGMSLPAPNGSWDLRGRRTVALDVVNLTDEPMQLAIGVNMPGGDQDAQKRIWNARDFGPREAATLEIELCNTPWVLDPPLDLVGMRSAPGQSPIDLREIVKVVPFLRTPKTEHHFLLGNLRAEGILDVLDSADFLPFIDRYGQFNKSEWPGKIHSDAELAEQLAAERAAHAARPERADVNRWGGWTAGPQLEATGHFRTAKHGGMWWLVDPDGRLFWSHGVDCVDPRFGGTGVEHRESYFAWLPPVEAGGDDPLSEHYGVGGWAPHGFYADKVPFRMYDFYNANLHRKFGDDWRTGFADLAHDRIHAWGMNTVAAWGSAAVYGQKKTPYTAFVWINESPKIAGNSGYWGQIHDVFDPRFRAAVRKSIQDVETDAGESTDPWNIGYFVDNEIQWGSPTGLAIDVLTSPAEQAAKKVLVEDLRETHGEIASLNAAWGTSYASWDALLRSTAAPPDAERAAPDLRPFNLKIYDTYFRTVKEELRKIAPDKLYLGCRFAWQNDEVVRASARYCDVVSMNKYEFDVSTLRLPADIDRPLIIGEFHFGANDRGMFHAGLKKVDDAAARGDAYRHYVGGAVRNPQIVGTGWFQYMDQASVGRADGENYNVGLVTTTDTPHAELVEAIRDVGDAMYEDRLAAGQ